MQPNLAPIPLLFDALRNSLHIENCSRMINAAGFWRKVILVPKVILRYGRLKSFSLDQKKGPKEGL